MRLQILKSGHSFLQKLQLRVIKKMMGEVPGPIAVMSYRREFFGKYYAQWLHKAMRKMKHWTIGEVELMAAYVSKNNACQYCYGDHTAVAKNVYEEQVIQAIMDNVDTAPIDEKLKVTLKFIKKLTLTPSELNKKDLEPLRAVDLSNEAIREAIHVCGAFSVVNRLADAFDFEMSPRPAKVGRFLFKNGYGMASIKG